MRARAPLVHDSMGGFKVWYHVVGSLMDCNRKASQSLAAQGVLGLMIEKKLLAVHHSP